MADDRQVVSMDTVAESVYQIDPNGIPIKPGYRKPFNSETARIAGFKGARELQRKALARKMERENRILFEVLTHVKASLEKRSKRGPRVVLQKSGHGKNAVENSPISPSQISPSVRPSSRPKPAPAPVIPPPVDDYDGLF